MHHDRSLDEFVQDYLRYFEIGLGHSSWEAHNRVMIHGACTAVANRYGWDYVTRYPWWPEAKRISFQGEEIDGN